MPMGLQRKTGYGDAYYKIDEVSFSCLKIGGYATLY